MFISETQLLVMLICASVMAGMMTLLFIANYRLLKDNRFLRSRLSVWRKRCQREHVEKPF
jgi:hypothetical protein